MANGISKEDVNEWLKLAQKTGRRAFNDFASRSERELAEVVVTAVPFLVEEVSRLTEEVMAAKKGTKEEKKKAEVG